MTMEAVLLPAARNFVSAVRVLEKCRDGSSTSNEEPRPCKNVICAAENRNTKWIHIKI
jgi:hypothetical protein